MHRYHALILFSRTLAFGLVGLLVITTVWAQGVDRSFEITAEDGVTIYGDLFEPENVKRPPLILAFHQGGGDGRGEYAPIIPRLVSEGFAVMSVDQRRGGSVFGRTNRTVAALGDVEYSYCDAYLDLKATLEYALTQGFGRIIVWGSSYSASLAVRLAADNPETVDRVIAFSPASGEAMTGCAPREAAARLEVPALLLRPSKEAEIPSVAADLDAFEEMGHATYVSEGGSHGSSILVQARVGHDASATWTRVLAFLNED